MYTISVAYADVLPVSDEQILEEANPWAVMSHQTALIHHQLTDAVATAIHATVFSGHSRLRTPLGTKPEDWLDMRFPQPRKPKHIDGVPVVWVSMKEALDWGSEVGDSQGVPIYVTDLERTLLDALRQPAKAGGAFEVLRAWGRAREKLNLDRLVEYTDRYSVKILRQRVGFLLGMMGFHHKALGKWKEDLLRGGSVKLIAGSEYHDRYDTAWNLSINVPDSAIEALRE